MLVIVSQRVSRAGPKVFVIERRNRPAYKHPLRKRNKKALAGLTRIRRREESSQGRAVGIAFERLDRVESNMMTLPANSGILFQGSPNMVRSKKASTWCREIARTSMKPTIITAHPDEIAHSIDVRRAERKSPRLNTTVMAAPILVKAAWMP
jgi:hypothetical protein